MKKINYLKPLLCVAVSVALIGCSGTRYNRSTGQYIDDKALSARVNSALAKDSMTSATDINVQTFRGNVHLTGFVDHQAQKERAAQLARNVQGVNWFKNDIVVKDALPGESQMLSRQITDPAGATPNEQQRQQAAPPEGQSQGWNQGTSPLYDPAADISVRSKSGFGSPRASEQSASRARQSTSIATEPPGSSTDPAERSFQQSQTRGKITLRGTVASEEQKRSIEESLRNLPGINEVENELEVENQ